MRKAVDRTAAVGSVGAARNRHHSEQGDQKRQQIVAKAGELFARFGFKKCTIEDIASACNLTKAALYHYFDSKEALFAAVIGEEAEALLRKLREVVDSERDPVAKVLKYSSTRFDTVKALANLYGVTQIPRPLQPQFDEAIQRFQEDELHLLQGILDYGVVSGCFRPVNTYQVARVLLAGSKGVMLEFVFTEDTEVVKATITDMARIVCFGLVQK